MEEKYNEKIIIELYRQGYSAYKIMEELNLTSKFKIYSILNNIGITRTYDRCHVPISRNRDYFKKIDTEVKAYILGFLFADGCMHSHNKGFSLALHKKDINMLKLIKEELNLNNKLVPVKNKNAISLHVVDHILHEDLITLGCVPKKSLILEPPINLPTELISHFIRGHFDGDGSVYKRTGSDKDHFRFGYEVIGTKKLLEWISLNMGLDLRIFPKHNVYVMQTTSKKKLNQIYNYMYKNSNYYFERKHDIFVEASAV
jgi:hypothetical protein